MNPYMLQLMMGNNWPMQGVPPWLQAPYSPQQPTDIGSASQVARGIYDPSSPFYAGADDAASSSPQSFAMQLSPKPPSFSPDTSTYLSAILASGTRGQATGGGANGALGGLLGGGLSAGIGGLLGSAGLLGAGVGAGAGAAAGSGGLLALLPLLFA